MNKFYLQTSRGFRRHHFFLASQRQARFNSLAVAKGHLVEATVERIRFRSSSSKAFQFAIYDVMLPTGDTLKCQGMMPNWVHRGDEVTTALVKDSGKGVFDMLPLHLKSWGQRQLTQCSPLPTTPVRSQPAEMRKAIESMSAFEYLKRADLWVPHFLRKLEEDRDTDGKLRKCVKALVNDWPNCVFLDTEYFTGRIKVDASERYRTLHEVGIWKVSRKAPFGALLKIKDESFKKRQSRFGISDFPIQLPERWGNTERGFNKMAIFPSEMCRAIAEYLSDDFFDNDNVTQKRTKQSDSWLAKIIKRAATEGAFRGNASSSGPLESVRPLTVFHHFGNDHNLMTALFEHCADNEATARQLAERMQFVNTRTLLRAIVPKPQVNSGWAMEDLLTELFPAETHSELGIDWQMLHTAAMDARCVYLLVNCFREHILQHSDICEAL